MEYVVQELPQELFGTDSEYLPNLGDALLEELAAALVQGLRSSGVQADLSRGASTLPADRLGLILPAMRLNIATKDLASDALAVLYATAAGALAGGSSREAGVVAAAEAVRRLVPRVNRLSAQELEVARALVLLSAQGSEPVPLERLSNYLL